MPSLLVWLPRVLLISVNNLQCLFSTETYPFLTHGNLWVIQPSCTHSWGGVGWGNSPSRDPVHTFTDAVGFVCNRSRQLISWMDFTEKHYTHTDIAKHESSFFAIVSARKQRRAKLLWDSGKCRPPKTQISTSPHSEAITWSCNKYWKLNILPLYPASRTV